MKITKILKILGVSFLAVGITLVVLGTAVFTDSTFMGMPNVAMLIPGVMLIFFSFSSTYLWFCARTN